MGRGNGGEGACGGAGRGRCPVLPRSQTRLPGHTQAGHSLPACHACGYGGSEQPQQQRARSCSLRCLYRTAEAEPCTAPLENAAASYPQQRCQLLAIADPPPGGLARVGQRLLHLAGHRAVLQEAEKREERVGKGGDGACVCAGPACGRRTGGVWPPASGLRRARQLTSAPFPASPRPDSPQGWRAAPGGLPGGR